MSLVPAMRIRDLLDRPAAAFRLMPSVQRLMNAVQALHLSLIHI